MEIKQYSTVEEAKSSTAAYISSLLEREKGHSLLFYSGGSCLSIVPQIQFSSSVVLTAIDERFDEKESNFLHFTSQYPEFIKQFSDKNHHVIDTHPQALTLLQMADWYEQTVKIHIATVRQLGGVCVVLLGMGEDGHIAGILPHPHDEKMFYDRFLKTNRWVVGYDATGKNQFPLRFTLTYPGLMQADEIVVFLGGKKKRDRLESGFSNRESLYTFPAQFLSQTSQPVHIFMSEDL